MLITDLFSHKIHSSGDDWPEKLIDIATIFNRFDGQPYDREAIELELLKLAQEQRKLLVMHLSLEMKLVPILHILDYID